MYHCSRLSHCHAMIYDMVYNYCPNFIGHFMLLLPLSWSVALSSTTFPHTSQTRPTTTSQKGCLSSAIPLTNTSSSSSSHHCLTSIVTWITCWLHVTYHFALAIGSQLLYTILLYTHSTMFTQSSVTSWQNWTSNYKGLHLYSAVLSIL